MGKIQRVFSSPLLSVKIIPVKFIIVIVGVILRLPSLHVNKCHLKHQLRIQFRYLLATSETDVQA